MQFIERNILKIFAMLIIGNSILSTYLILENLKQSEELEKVGIALGQVGQVFTDSRLVTVDKERGVVVNQVITTKDVQEQQPTF